MDEATKLGNLQAIIIEAQEILKDVPFTEFTSPGVRGNKRQFKVWPGTDKEYTEILQRYIKANEALGIKKPRSAAAKHLGTLVRDGLPAKIHGGLAHQTKAITYGSQTKTSDTRIGRAKNLKAWTPEEWKYYESLRDKPVMKSIAGVIPPGDIHKHHILIAELLKPFADGRPQAEVDDLVRLLHSKGWFAGDHNKNLIWLSEQAHLTDEASVHKLIKELTDIQGKPVGEKYIQGFGPTTTGKTYKPGYGAGFSIEHIEDLKKMPLKDVRYALNTYIDTVGDQLKGSVVVADRLVAGPQGTSDEFMNPKLKRWLGAGNEVFNNLVEYVEKVPGGKTALKVTTGTVAATAGIGTRVLAKVPAEYVAPMWKALDGVVATMDEVEKNKAIEMFKNNPTQETLDELRFRQEAAILSKAELGDPTNVSTFGSIGHMLFGRKEWYREMSRQIKDTSLKPGETYRPGSKGMEIIGQNNEEAAQIPTESTGVLNQREGTEDTEEELKVGVSNFNKKV